jgi:4-aminobutyrate aminotransferase
VGLLSPFVAKLSLAGLERRKMRILKFRLLIFATWCTGRKLLDFTSGIGVTNTGHCHPKVVKAAQDQVPTSWTNRLGDFRKLTRSFRSVERNLQVGKLMHVQMGIAYHEPVLQLAEELKTVVPKGLDQFFFSNR